MTLSALDLSLPPGGLFADHEAADPDPIVPNPAGAGRDGRGRDGLTIRRNGDRSTSTGITAAAMRIDLSSSKQVAAAAKGSAKWQASSWDFVDVVPEGSFAIMFLSNAGGRVRLFPALQVDPDEAPISVLDDQEKSTNESLVPTQWALAAQARWAEFTNDQDGQAGIVRQTITCLAVSGEVYIVGYDPEAPAVPDDGVPAVLPPEQFPKAGAPEQWFAFSESAIMAGPQITVLDPTAAGGTRSVPSVRIKQTPDDNEGLPIPADAYLYRGWRRHARWPGWATSAMRSLGGVCRRLLLLEAAIESAAKSGMNGGVFTIPKEADEDDEDPEPVDLEGDDDTGPGAANAPVRMSRIDRAYFQHVKTAVEDPASAAASAAFLLRLDKELLETSAVRFIDTSRKIDAVLVDRLNLERARLASGLDVPPEVVTGVADVNHWTAWQIEDATYKAHVEPALDLAAWVFLVGYLRPALEADGCPKEVAARIVLGKDPSALVLRPNRAADSKDLGKEGGLSMTARRRHLGFPEEDRPEPFDLMLQAAWKANDLLAVRSLLTRLDPTLADIEVTLRKGSSGDNTDTSSQDGAPPPDPTPPPEQAVRASGSSAGRPGNLGQRLVDVDRSLRQRLQVAADAALADAVRVAGSRLRAAAQGNPDARALVHGLPASRIGAALGRSRAYALGQSEDDLFAGTFDGMAERWDSWVSAAQTRTAALLAKQTGEPQAEDDYLEDSDQDRDAGWTILLAALLGLAVKTLFEGPQAPGAGEAPLGLSVPTGPIREAMARAGGAAEPTMQPRAVDSRDTGIVGGVATGTRSVTVLATYRNLVVGYSWSYGDPGERTAPFDSHLDLDGVEFTSWTDDVLINSFDSWLDAFYYPGDHYGCQCDAVPQIVDLDAQELEPPDDEAEAA